MMVHIPTNQEAIEWAARNREEQRRRNGSEPHEKAAETIASLRAALEKANLINECHCVNIEAITRERDEAEAQREQAQKDAKDARALLGEAAPWVQWGAPLRARITEFLA